MAAKSPPTPRKTLDGGYGWVIVLGCCICNFLLVGMSRSMGVLYNMYLYKFKDSAAATSTFLAIYNTLRMILGPVASTLCEKFGCRLVVMCGGLLFGLGFIISSMAHNLIFLNISFGVVCGVGGAFIFTPPYIIVGQYFDKKKGRAMSLSTIGAGFGTIALAPLQSMLLEFYGSFGALLITGAIEMNICVAGALFRPKVTETEDMQAEVVTSRKDLEKLKQDMGDLFSSLDRISIASEVEKGNSELWGSEPNEENMELNNAESIPDHQNVTVAIIPSRDGAYMDVSEKLSNDLIKDNQLKSKEEKCGERKRKASKFLNGTYIIYLLNMMCMPFVLMTAMIYLPAFAQEAGADDIEASLMLSIMGVADIVGRFLWGFMFDLECVRDKKRRQFMFGITGIMFGISVVILGFCNSIPMLGVCIFFYGVVEGGYHSQRMTLLGEFLTKQEIADGVGWSICFQGVGCLISTPLLGHVKDVFKTFRVGYFIGGAIFCCMSLLLILDYIVKKSCSKRQRRK